MCILVCYIFTLIFTIISTKENSYLPFLMYVCDNDEDITYRCIGRLPYKLK